MYQGMKLAKTAVPMIVGVSQKPRNVTETTVTFAQGPNRITTLAALVLLCI